MWAVFIVLVLSAAVILMVGWDRRTGLLDPKRFREAPLIPTRKQRFAEYVRGERQLMAEWEEAFGPAPRVSFRYFNDDYLELRYGVPKKLMDPYQPFVGHSPSMRLSSSQVCWNQARP